MPGGTVAFPSRRYCLCAGSAGPTLGRDRPFPQAERDPGPAWLTGHAARQLAPSRASADLVAAFPQRLRFSCRSRAGPDFTPIRAAIILF